MKFSRRNAHLLCWICVAVVGIWIFGPWQLPIPTWITEGMRDDPIINNESRARTILKVFSLPIALFLSQWFITLLVLKLRTLFSIVGFVWLYVMSIRGALNVAAVAILLFVVIGGAIDAGSSMDSYFVKIFVAIATCTVIASLQPPVAIVLGSSANSCDILDATGAAIRPLRTVHLFRGQKPNRMIHVTPYDNMRTIFEGSWRTSVRLLISSARAIVIDGRFSTLPIDDELEMIRRKPPRGVVILVTRDDGSAPLLENHSEARDEVVRWVRVRFSDLYGAVSSSLYL